MMAGITGDAGGGREVLLPVDLPGNSNSSRERKPRVERIVESEVVQRTPSVWSRVANTFLGSDMRTVGSGVLFDVVIPSLKELLFETGKEGLARSLYGGAERPNQHRPGAKVNYSGLAKTTKIVGSGLAARSERPEPTREMRVRHDFSELYLPTKGEAEKTLDALFDLVDQYEVANVADLYDLLGIQRTYVDERWGWLDLRGSSTEWTRHGYRLNLPKPIQIP